MNDLMNIAEQRFGPNKPIFLQEMLQLSIGVSERTTYRQIDEAIRKGRLAKAQRGIYYIPTQTRFGPSTLSDASIIKKKYVSDGDDIYGYVSGLMLENRLGLSEQVPGTLEIVTNKETNRSRRIPPLGGYREVVLRKPRVPVTADNVSALEILDLLMSVSLSSLDERALSALKQAAGKVDRKKLLKCAQFYPAKASKAITESEAIGVLA